MGIGRIFKRLIRNLVAALPRSLRFAIYRSMVHCDPAPSERLVLKIAETAEELSACFTLLHDAYVNAGFMKPDPSGMRVTIYHALPTTTTLCAKWDGEVVGTISLIRESPLGLPLQQVFDLTRVRAIGGSLAEVSALAVHDKFRNTGGVILFPLMKFMYEYCRRYFDTRHLVIAVNPNRIEMYESLLGFHRLTQNVVGSYDFANGAPAVGAAVDLEKAPAALKRLYLGKPPHKNLYHYFLKQKLANLKFPGRRYYTTNDPVLTPNLLDYFFNVRTNGFESLDERKLVLLHAVYDRDRYRDILPPLPGAPQVKLRQSSRFSVKCPAELRFDEAERKRVPMTVVEISSSGFGAYFGSEPPVGEAVDAVIRLGRGETAKVRAVGVRSVASENKWYCGFRVEITDLPWKKFVNALNRADTHAQLQHATVFMD